MTVQINFYRPCDPHFVILPGGRTILKDCEIIEEVELNWTNTKAYRVLSAIGLLGSKGSIYELSSPLADDIATLCQNACNRIRERGVEWLSDFIGTDPATAMVVGDLGGNVIDCSNNDLQEFGMNILRLRNACEKAIEIGGDSVVIQFN